MDCYYVSCELLSASISDALLFVNSLVFGIFHGRFAQRLAVNKPCLQIIRRLLWKQTTTHSIRNNNPMFDGNLLLNFYDRLSTPIMKKIGCIFHLDVQLRTYLLHLPLLLREGLPQLGRELPLPARLERQLDHLATVTRGGWTTACEKSHVSILIFSSSFS